VIAPTKVGDYAPIATKLAFEYPFYGSGADEQDVYQVAMIAAWDTIRKEPNIEPRFISRRMRLRVIDFVQIRSRDRQRRLERDILPVVAERGGTDMTLATVLARDELQRAVIAFKRLPKRQRAYLSGHLNGKPHKDIMPDRKPQSADAMIMRARKRMAAELAA
jgi:DNA-directed RNA polymerase specialized sigma24 family protein